MIKNRFLMGIGMAGLLAVAGCRSVNMVEPEGRINAPSAIADKRIVTDPSLARRVQVVSLGEAEGAGGHIRVQAEVRNTTRNYRTFNYKFEWFDEDGILVELPSSGYQRSQLEGGESRMLTSVAPTAEAKDFRLKLIEKVR